eukprot:scaffold33469_cov74-Phaeocystis_antarctica.AAC.6
MPGRFAVRHREEHIVSLMREARILHVEQAAARPLLDCANATAQYVVEHLCRFLEEWVVLAAEAIEVNIFDDNGSRVARQLTAHLHSELGRAAEVRREEHLRLEVVDLTALLLHQSNCGRVELLGDTGRAVHGKSVLWIVELDWCPHELPREHREVVELARRVRRRGRTYAAKDCVEWHVAHRTEESRIELEVLLSDGALLKLLEHKTRTSQRAHVVLEGLVNHSYLE